MDPTELINFDRIDKLPLGKKEMYFGVGVFNENIDINRTLAVLRGGRHIKSERKRTSQQDLIEFLQLR